MSRIWIVLIAILGLIAYVALSGALFDECGLSEKQAREMVMEELKKAGLNPRYLSSATPQGTCSYDYYFEGQGQKLNYVVMSTWLHGVKLNRWDYRQEEQERSRALHGTRREAARP